MSAIPSTSSSSSSSVANTTSLISNAITSSLGSVVYRVKWSNSHNSSWLNQNRDGLCSREQTQLLFDQLVDSKVYTIYCFSRQANYIKPIFILGNYC